MELWAYEASTLRLMRADMERCLASAATVAEQWGLMTHELQARLRRVIGAIDLELATRSEGRV